MSAEPYVYVASSWRNDHQPTVIDMIRNEVGIAAYDFKDEEGFRWSEVANTPPETWGVDYMLYVLGKERSIQGFHRDFDAMKRATHCILVLPCGRSAHLEAGWMIGQGKPTAIYIPEYDGPDLMWLMADLITESMDELARWVQRAGQ